MSLYSPNTPQKSENEQLLQKNNNGVIGVSSLVCLIFFSVSGGPYATEEAVQSAGPFW